MTCDVLLTIPRPRAADWCFEAFCFVRCFSSVTDSGNLEGSKAMGVTGFLKQDVGNAGCPWSTSLKAFCVSSFGCAGGLGGAAAGIGGTTETGQTSGSISGITTALFRKECQTKKATPIAMQIKQQLVRMMITTILKSQCSFGGRDVPQPNKFWMFCRHFLPTNERGWLKKKWSCSNQIAFWPKKEAQSNKAEH